MVLFRKRPIGPCATLINISIYQKHNTRNFPIKKEGNIDKIRINLIDLIDLFNFNLFNYVILVGRSYKNISCVCSHFIGQR